MPNVMRFLGEAIAPEILAAAGESTDGDAKSFSMLAYTGGKMNVGFEFPVVVDLAGLALPKTQLPIYANHYSKNFIGHVDARDIVNDGATLALAGKITNTVSPLAQEIIAMSRNGTKWQASIGAAIEKAVTLKAGETKMVNGREVEGPAIIVRKARLYETSFVPLGADSNTSVNVAASHKISLENRSVNMDFAKWLEATFGVKAEDLTAEQVTKFQAQFDARGDASGAKEPEVKADGIREEIDAVKAELAEARRVNGIAKVCAAAPEIADKAVKGNWTVEQAESIAKEVADVRAARPQAFAIGSSENNQADAKVLEAAVLNGTIRATIREKKFDAKTLEAADKIGKLNSFQDLAIRAAALEGKTLPHRTNTNEFIRAALSVTGLSGILGNVANKSMLDGYDMVEQAWRQIASVASVNDFKTHTRYRLTSDMQYAKVGPGGEFSHGALDELSYTQRADTYGIMYSLTRQMIINDDLGALNSMARQLGIGAGDAINDAFWTEFMDNSTFFASGNSNVGTGALSITSLTSGVSTFKKQTKPNGRPLGWEPNILLVPVDLDVVAQQLYADLQVNERAIEDSATANPAPNSNPHRGKYRPVSSVFLSNSSYTNYSATAWYLLTDPMRASTIEVAYLNGVDMPTVESADADFNTLGIQFRGYHDFGVSKQDYRAGFRSTGA
jgi:hypothetical protein